MSLNKKDGERAHAKSILDRVVYATPTSVLEKDHVIDTTAILKSALKIGEQKY